MESQDFRNLTQMMANMKTRREMFKRAGAGALAALAVTALPRVAGAEPNAIADTHVYASGISAIPTEELVWRLVADRASPIGDGEPLERALGFAMATSGPIRIFDDAAGTEMYLQMGESAFVREAAFERRESLNQHPTPYLRIGLVPPVDASYTAGGGLIYASRERFAAPAGERLIELVGATLGMKEQAELPNTGTPTLVLSTAGRVLVSTFGGGDPVLLEAGRAVDFAIGMTIIGAGDGENRFLAAQIGGEV
jgi:hypothetical protein